MKPPPQFIKNLERFQLITFDVTNTLLKPAKSIIQYRKTAKDFGIDIHPERLEEEVHKQYRQMDASYPNFGASSKNMDWKTWWEEVVVQAFKKVNPDIPHSKAKDIANRLIDIYKTKEAWSVVDDGIELVHQCRTIGKKVGVISNNDPRMEYVFCDLGIRDHFDFLLNSYEAGVAKPDPGIFNKALEIVPCDKSECLHIGDSYGHDYIGATISCWSALLVQKRQEKTFGVPPEHHFWYMRDLKEALEKRNMKW